MISRRALVLGTSVGAVGLGAAPDPTAQASDNRFSALPAAFARLEKMNGGRLGVDIVETGSGKSIGHRENERFPMCSTFKFLLAAAVLRRTDEGKEKLERTIAIPSTGLLSHSPDTLQHAGSRMTVRDLSEAIMTRSDNTAANLLLASVGGPAGLTRFASALGDRVTRLDRTELALNESLPSDPRDTTSPASMAGNLRRLLLEDELSEASRQQLIEWLIANKTGDERLRAGLATNWRVGDKTGSNGENTTNDIAIVWPAGKPPMLIAAYITGCSGPEAKRNALLAHVGSLVASAVL